MYGFNCETVFSLVYLYSKKTQLSCTVFVNAFDVSIKIIRETFLKDVNKIDTLPPIVCKYIKKQLLINLHFLSNFYARETEYYNRKKLNGMWSRTCASQLLKL